MRPRQEGDLVDLEPGTRREAPEFRLNVWHLRALLLLEQDKFRPAEDPTVLPVKQGQLQMFCDAVSAGIKHIVSQNVA